MKRKYSVAEYLDFVHLANETVPDLCIGTDILVGSPGETEADFEQSCNVLMKSPVAYAHVFTYSERDGTPAARAADHVPVPIRQQRNAVLRRLSARKRHVYDSSYEGKLATVLFEESRDGCWPGYTDNYIRVAVTSLEPLHNTIRQVRLLRRAADFVVAELAA
jgi:threonylcarbamoyladenosine tRNA methylthiotransferase MtaB